MVFAIGADIPDMGECEQHDLRGVGGVRKDLLIARNRCIETQFTDTDAFGASAVSKEYRTVRQGDCSRG
jgi:hypothetical protein